MPPSELRGDANAGIHRARTANPWQRRRSPARYVSTLFARYYLVAAAQCTQWADPASSRMARSSRRVWYVREAGRLSSLPGFGCPPGSAKLPHLPVRRAVGRAGGQRSATGRSRNDGLAHRTTRVSLKRRLRFREQVSVFTNPVTRSAAPGMAATDSPTLRALRSMAAIPDAAWSAQKSVCGAGVSPPVGTRDVCACGAGRSYSVLGM